ncbi:MAG: hypothetical protein ACYCW6_10200 [Candidatus Xenobia bacterium]
MLRSGARRRGFAIGSVLLLSIVVVLVGVSIGALTIYQLLSSEQATNSRDAVLLAESAINQVVERMSSPPIGSFGTSPSDNLIYMPDSADPGRTGVVTFTPGALPWSTNNLNPGPPAWDLSRPGGLQVGYNNVPVPPGYARLIGTGTSRGVVRHVEVMVTRKHFPYGLAWAGALNADTFAVIGCGSLANFVTNGGFYPPYGAYIACPAACLGTLTSTNPAFISGNLYYSGAPPALPAGSTLLRAERAFTGLEIPAIPIATLISNASGNVPGGATSFTPAATCSAGNYSCATNPVPAGSSFKMTNAILQTSATMGLSGGDLTLQNSVLIVSGNLTITAGHNLVLFHSLVYVSGNVVISGSISGSGAMLANGHITLAATPFAGLGEDTEVGVLAAAGLRINPPFAGGPGVMQGLFYNGGASNALTFNGTLASPLSVGGVCISRGDVNMTSTTIVGIPECAYLRFTTCSPASPPAFGDTVPFGPPPPPPALQAFKAADVQPGYATTALTSGEVSSIVSAVAALSGASPAYAGQVVAGQEPLLGLCFPPSVFVGTGYPGISVQLQGLNYDPNINRYDAFQGDEIYQNAGSGVSEQAFLTGAPPGTNAEDLKLCLQTAQHIAADTANNLLANDESAALSGGTSFQSITYPGGLPSAPPLEKVSLDLAQWLTRTTGEPSLAPVAWRTF